MNDMLEQVLSTVSRHGLLEENDKVLVALSGGADSVCLLDCLLKLSERFRLSVSAAHLHHGIRGAEADADEAFVRALCQDKQIPLYVRRCDIPGLALEAGIGLEEAGRRARYAFFYELQQEHGFTKIATAHHRDDNIETVLMRLLRGTGPLGLGGIPYDNNTVIRPLLDVSRQAIEAYCTACGLRFCNDSTNREQAYTRNKIRHSLLPMLEEDYNPNFRACFQEQIRQYAAWGSYIRAEADALMSRLAEPVPNGYSFDYKTLIHVPDFLADVTLQRLLCRLSGREITAVHIEAVRSILRQGRGAVDLPGGVRAALHYDTLYIYFNVKVSTFTYNLPKEGAIDISEAALRLECFLTDALPDCREKDAVYLNPQKLAGKKLQVRSRRPGDYFYPSGMTGRKKLQDYFVDEKVPRFMRDRIPIVTADEDIVWIAGYRADSRYLAAKEKSTVLCIRRKNSEKS